MRPYYSSSGSPSRNSRTSGVCGSIRTPSTSTPYLARAASYRLRCRLRSWAWPSLRASSFSFIARIVASTIDHPASRQIVARKAMPTDALATFPNHRFSIFSRFFQRIASFSSRVRLERPITHPTGQSIIISAGQSVPSTTRSIPTVSIR